MTSPADYIPQVDESLSPLSGLTQQHSSLSDSIWTGHVINDGYDSADHYSWYPGAVNDRSIPEREIGEKNWNEKENNMAGAGKRLDRRDSQDFYPAFPGDMEPLYDQLPMTPMEDIPETSPVAPPPPPPPLPSPVLAPVPSADVHLAGRGGKTVPVKVLAVYKAGAPTAVAGVECRRCRLSADLVVRCLSVCRLVY